MSYMKLAKKALAERVASGAPDPCAKCGAAADYYTPGGQPLCEVHAPKSTDGLLVRFAVDELGLTITGRRTE